MEVSLFNLEEWPVWLPFAIFFLGIALMIFVKVRLKGRKQMTEKEATLFYRGYLLSLTGSSFGIVMGFTYCMPYFS